MFSPEKKFSDWKVCGFCDQPAQIFESIESTHSLMKEQAKAGLVQPGALIVANSQIAGRGRHERTWASPAGKNLYFNLLLPLDGIPPASFAQITQIAALTFSEVFLAMGAAVTVKWPNDILFEKNKFCGILAEIVFLPGAKPALNMGVGINVNSEPEEYEFLGRAVTTLKAITGKTINREILLRALVAALERALGQFKAFGISPWVQAWRKMDKFIGARGTVVVNNHCTDENHNSGEGATKKSGCILDMQPDGSLLFKTDDGETLTVYSADLEI